MSTHYYERRHSRWYERVLFSPLALFIFGALLAVCLPAIERWGLEFWHHLDAVRINTLSGAFVAFLLTGIVLHQIGSHGPAYYERSTAPFQPFKPSCDTNAIQGCSQAELINSYDNSIVYTDHVLSGLIHALQDDPKYQAGFWYLSDHGESTGEHGMYLHGAPYAIAPAQQTHVPMLMWFSPEWKAQNAQQMACLSAQKSQELSQDNLFPSLLSLLGVQSQVIDPQYDMLKNCAPAKAGT